MVNQNKKDKAIVRYLVAGTPKILHEDELDLSLQLDLKQKTKEFLNQGYEVLESDLPKKAKDLQAGHLYTVYLRERVVVVFPHQPKESGTAVDGLKNLVWPEGLESKDLRVSYKRTIAYQYDNGEKVADDVVEEVVFERSAMVNLVTGDVTYMEWQAQGNQSFDEVETPVLSGYIADILSVAAVENIEFDSQEDKEDQILITYSKQPKQAQLLVLVEDSDEVLLDEVLKGTSNDPIEYPVEETVAGYVAQGYEVVSNPFEEEQVFSSDANEEQVFTIVLKPKVVALGLGEFPEIGQAIYPEMEGSPVWPEDLAEKELSKTITRTIVTQHEDGTEIDRVVQEVIFQRSARFNLLKQEAEYGEWTVVSENDNFETFTPEVLEGYSARPRRIPAVEKVTLDDQDSFEVITYSRKIQRVLLQFVEHADQDHVIYQEQLVGKTGEHLSDSYKKKIQEFINNGYDIVDNTIPENAAFEPNQDSNLVYKISLAPRQITVFPDQPKAAGSFIDDSKKTGPKWPVGVAEGDLNRLVTRTVYHVFENGKEALEPQVDGVYFQRQADVNLVTGQVTYGEWSQGEGTIDTYEVPEVAGYYADRENLPAVEGVTVDSTNFEVVVHYVKDVNQQAYIFYNATTQTDLESATISGRSSQKVQEELERRLTPYLNKGYKLENPNHLTLALKNDNADEVRVELHEVEVTVKPDSPRLAFGLVEGYTDAVWPAGLAHADLHKSVSRTVRFLTAEGQELAEDLVQTVNFQRTAQVNLVTSHVTYGQWQSKDSKFPAVEIPKFAGYACRQEDLPAVAVDVDGLDHVIELHYDAQPCLVTIVFVDEKSGEEVNRFSIPGKENQVLPFSNDLEGNLEHLGLESYTVVGNDLPSELHFKHEETIYTVQLVAKTITITADQAKPAYSKEEVEGVGVIDWPVGLEEANLTAHFVRTIRYCDQFGQELDQEAAEQVVAFTRHAEYNLANGEVTYSDWSTETSELPSLANPKIEGYETVEESVAAMAIEPNYVGQHLVTTVSYHQQPYQVKVTLINQLDEKVLKEVDIKTADKDEAKERIESLLAWYQSQGFNKISDDLDVSDWKATEEHNVKFVLEPQLIKISLDHVQSDFSKFEPEIADQLSTMKGLSSYNLSRQVSRTIKYVYTDGKEVVSSYKDEVTFKRSAWVNLVTGDVFYDAWASYYPVFDEVLSPVVEGHTASKEIVEAIEGVDADDNNIVETIIYTPNIQQMVVNLIDKSTGNVIYAESITNTSSYATSSKISEFVQKGKTIVSSHPTGVEAPKVVAKPETPKKVEAVEEDKLVTADESKETSKTEQVIVEDKVTEEVVSVEETVTEPETVIVTLADEELMETYQVDHQDLNNILTRKISYQLADGRELAETIIQEVSYQRSAIVTPETGQITFSDWEPVADEEFPEVVSPVIFGYQTEDKVIPAQEVVSSKREVEVTVVYTPVKAENLEIIFVEKSSGTELLNFNFVNKGADYTEKKIAKGQSFLEYKGYKIVESDYPDHGEFISEDTIRYKLLLVKVGEEVVEETEAKADEKAAKATVSEEKSSEENPKKSKGFFNRLFKDK